jgi:hypothetical protein
VAYLGGSDEDDENGGMDPELEMDGLRTIISKFSGALHEARSKGRVSGPADGAESRELHPKSAMWGG